MQKSTDVTNETIFAPREHIIWPETKSLKSVWSGIYLIENAASRQFWRDIFEREALERAVIREAVEDLIRGFSSERYRSWMSDLDFMAKILRAEQLEIYAPYFYKLCLLMPIALKRSRRRTVGQYIENRLPLTSPYMRRQYRKFVRSSVILYPATDLFELSDSFIRLMNVHQDQSIAKIRTRVSTMVRSLLMMSDEELISQYQSFNNYAEHLAFLKAQCNYLQLKHTDILSARFD